MHVERVTVGELKVVLAAVAGLANEKSDLFVQFPNCTLSGRLSSLDAASRSVDLTGAQAALLANEEDPVAVDDEQ
jgi:hypothetical protein